MILRGKDFWVRQIFMERHSEGEFLWDEAIWSRVLLQAHYYSTFWFSHNDVRQCLFFLIGFIQQLHWLIIVLNIFFRFEVEFFSTPKKKKQSSTTKKSYRVISRCACAKLRKNFWSGLLGLYSYKNLYPRLLHRENFVCCEESSTSVEN